MTEEIPRDRPYIRYVYLRKEDRDRFLDFARTIPRKDFIYRVTVPSGDHNIYTLRIKKQELVYLELAFKVIVRKQKKRKRTIVTPTGTRKTI